MIQPFFCFRSTFRAIIRLETLATQAIQFYFELSSTTVQYEQDLRHILLNFMESISRYCRMFTMSMKVNKTSAYMPQREESPVLKRDFTLSKSDYRPVTVLPAISKVFERLLQYRMGPYFENISTTNRCHRKQ